MYKQAQSYLTTWRGFFRYALLFAPLGRVMGCVPHADYRIRLGAFLTLDDVKFNVIALFQRFVSVQLDCGVMNEHIRPVFTSDESIALGVIEPLDLTFELGHRLLPSLVLPINR